MFGGIGFLVPTAFALFMLVVWLVVKFFTSTEIGKWIATLISLAVCWWLAVTAIPALLNGQGW